MYTENMSSEKEKPNVMQFIADFGGCGFWRMLWPQIILNMSGKAQVSHSQFLNRDLLHYVNSSAVHVQRQGRFNQLEFFKKLVALKKRQRFRLIYDADDVIFYEDLPEYNSAKAKIKEIGSYAKEIINICDEMTVSTPFLREYYLQNTEQKNITVLPNFPPLFWIGEFYSEEMILRNYRTHRNKPRILYAGSSSHFHKDEKGGEDDFSHVKEVIMATIGSFRWVFVGAIPIELVPLIKQNMIEYHPWQHLASYPRYLSKLQINMCIAPLQDNLFNRGKSDLKFLESAALGLPIACQDLCTYAIAPIRFKTELEMIKRIQDTLATEETFLAASRHARSLIEGRWLEREENINKYLDVYVFPYGDSRRKYV